MMNSFLALAERVTPADLHGSAAELIARFVQEPALDFVAVVDHDRPVGLFPRSSARSLPHDRLAGLTVAAVMDPEPFLADIAEEPAVVRARLVDTPGVAGVVVVSQGRYFGVCPLAALLRAAGEEQRVAPPSRDQFLDVISHEIRTALNGVLAMAELLQRQPLSADARTYANTLVDSSKSLLGVLADAVDLSRGVAGRLDMTPRPTPLRELMDDVQAAWRGRGGDSVNLLVSYDGDDLTARIDAERLRQVFGLLIEQAVRLTRHGAVEAALYARRVDGGVLIEGRVRDTGAGYSPERLARIFEIPTEPGGAGLALPLCRRIIDAMQGSIRAESNTGAGATITFDLMAEEAAPAAAGAEPAPHIGDGGRSAHVLVVDDNATNRMVAEALCEMFDCTSECAEDGVEALEAARTGRFDLILMDIKMPRMDGVEATRAIRSLGGAVGGTPIIALTANADPDDAAIYLAAGMNAVVEKPIKPERLLAAMTELLPTDAAADTVAAA